MIITTREEIFEKLESKTYFSPFHKFLILPREPQQQEEKFEMVENPQDNKIPTFLNPIEPIASDIRPGFISPNEDLSLAEFKVSPSINHSS